MTAAGRYSAIFGSFLLISTVVQAVEPTDSTDPVSGQRVVELFQVGAASNPRAMADSKRLYDSLSVDTGNDPRIDYAYGLVLLKLLKPKEALAQFQVATGRPGIVFRPAWQAMIWLCMNTKSYDEGYQHLVDYAKVIFDPEKFPEELQHDEIYWIGRLMSALELIPQTPQSHELWVKTDTRMTDLFGAQFNNSYLDGKQDMRIRHELIEEKIRRDREKLESAKAQKREKELQSKNKALEAANENGENLKRSAREAKETKEEEGAAYKRQVQRSDKDRAFIERRMSILMEEMVVLDQQISLLQNNKQQTPIIANRLNAIQNNRFLKDLEFQRLAVLVTEVSVAAQQQMEQQAQFLDQAQREAAEREEKEKKNETAKARAQKQMAELKKSEANAKGVADKAPESQSFRSYIDLDLNAERDKVLTSFGIKTAKK